MFQVPSFTLKIMPPLPVLSGKKNIAGATGCIEMCIRDSYKLKNKGEFDGLYNEDIPVRLATYICLLYTSGFPHAPNNA